MSRTIKKIITGMACAVIFWAWPVQGRADYDYINISNPFLKKIPIAIPVFKAFSKSSAEIGRAHV